MALLMNIKELPEGISFASFTAEKDEFPLEYEDAELTGDVKVKGDLTKNRDQIIFRGKFTAPVELDCARCAESFVKEIENELIFVLKFSNQLEMDEDEEDSEDFFIIPEGTLEFDFTPLVRERIILDIGLKPLCREACAGVEAVAKGKYKNVNLKSDDDSEDTIDERWRPLKELKDRS